jgi:hypothetical protein
MDVPATLRSGAGQAWTVRELTAAQSRAYKRPKEPAPKFEATGPSGSIIRRATLEALTDAVSRVTRRD